jgi:N utilization substance protein A
MTGWRVDIKSETQVAQEAAYADVEWAEGEWILNDETGEQVWQPEEGGPEVSAGQWTEAATEGGEEEE